MPKTAAARLAALGVIFTDTATCDARGEHEVRVISDGHLTYAYPIDRTGAPSASGTDCGGTTRHLVTLTIACGQPTRDDEPCGGEITVRLDTPGTWIQNPKHAADLAAYGEQVEF